MKLKIMFLAALCLLIIPFQGLSEERLQNCDIDDLQRVLKAWNAPTLQCEVNDQGIVYFGEWDGKRPSSDYGVRIVADEHGAIKYYTFTCVYGEPDDFALCLEAFPDDAEEDRTSAMQWIAAHLAEKLEKTTVEQTYGDITLSLMPAGVLTVRPADEAETVIAAANEAQKITFDHKPGIAGSNAYDLTISAEAYDLTVGKRQATSDGYSWFITGSSCYGSYTITIETNKAYEIHRAVFSHAGLDATFFPWAVTLPIAAADIEGATAWAKACQKSSRVDTFTTGDAVWTYKPYENGQRGGVLTLTVDTYEEYGLYLIDQLE